MDYGVGNIFSISKSIENLNFRCNFVKKPSDFIQNEKIILPGVGSFPDCKKLLQKKQLDVHIINEAKKGTTTGGKRLPKLNDKFKFDDKKNSTRTTFMLLDTGTLPTGDSEEQIEKSSLENFESQTVLNQAIRRYNQLYSVVETITIAGDFSLHAGDVIFVDFPSIQAEKDDTVDKE